MEIRSLSDKWGWVPVTEEQDSEEEEGPVMGGNAPAGGIKAPAIKVKKSDLIKTVKKLEAKLVKMKELKKLKNVKKGDGEAYGEDGKSYKELYENAKSDYEYESQKRVDCEKENKRLEGDIRDFKSQIETLKREKVTLGHEKAILENVVVYKVKALTKSEEDVTYFKTICHGPQVGQYPSTNTLGGTSVSQRGLSPHNFAAAGFVSPP